MQPGVEVVILNPDANGVQQMADYLQQHDIQNLDAISIVADGADGELQLGTTLLSASNVASFQPQLAEIGTALKPGGDLLLYGCDVAQNGAGDAFLGDLAAATGVVNIAAASHVVGSAAEGGSFNLDVDVDLGNAATGPFTPAAVAAYPDLLGTASNLVWYITESSTTSQTGVYTIDVNGSATATSPNDIISTPSAPFTTIDGLAIDPSAGVYFVANFLPNGPNSDTNQIIEGNISGGTPSVIYTSGNNGGDAIVGLAFDQLNGLLYLAVTDANVGSSNTTTGIYTISAIGTGTRTATDLVNLSSGAQAPNDIAIDTTNNLLFYTDGVPGLTGVEEVGVANLSTGAIINSDLVSYSASGSVEPYGIAVDPATDTLYWTTVNFTGNSGNAIYSATYSTGGSVNLSDTQTPATTSQGQAPIGIALDVPAGGYYVDTSTGISNDTMANEVLFGSSLTSPETLTSVYSVPDQDGGTETLPTEAIVVEVQPTVTASGTVSYVHGDAAIAIDSTATVADADGYYLASATVSIASGMGTGDTLSFTNQNGITGVFSSGMLTLTGVASAANYQAALDSVTFSTTTSTSATPRTIDWTVSDGVVTSPTTTSTVDVQVPPVVTAGGTVTFDGGGSPVVLDSGLVVTDASSSNLVGASVTIVSATSTDRLNFSNQNGITGSYNTSNGVLTLTGATSVGNYQAALESITYSVSPTDSDPTNGGGDTGRTIDWTVNDGTLSSSVVTSTVDEVHVAPTVTAGASAMYAESGAAVVLDSSVTITDADSAGNLVGATVTISGALSTDMLNFTTQNGITGSYTAGSGELTLTGTTTIGNYDAALSSITYSNSGDPTNGGTDANRTISWVVNDGAAESAAADSSLTTLCFCAGTGIATPRGEVAVQSLAVGDMVLTASGAPRKIIWIGAGRVRVTRGRRSAATPVIVHKGALADNVPHHDLRVSKGHALCLDEVLIPVEFLVNHRSIVWDDRAGEVSLYHVELDTHDVLLANGAPAESYRDDGNRWLFQNANSGWGLPPLAPCRPVLTGGPVVDAAWRHLLDRAGARPGVPLTDDPDLHLLVDGERIDHRSRPNGRWVFPLSVTQRQVRIVSHAVVPAELGLAREARPLGVAIRRIAFWQGAAVRMLDAADPRLAVGFHSFEPDNGYRWTDGDAEVPAELFARANGPFRLELELAETTRYPLLAAA